MEETLDNHTEPVVKQLNMKKTILLKYLFSREYKLRRKIIIAKNEENNQMAVD